MDLGLSGIQMIGGNAETVANGGNIVEAEAAAADLLNFVCPVHMEVVAFGAYISEDFVTQATDAVVQLGKRSTKGGTITALKNLTLGNSNTAGLTRGNGDGFSTVQYPKDNQVALAADTDLDNGHVVMADLASVNLKFAPGEVIVLRHETAATGAGGSYVPFALVKISGPDYTSAKVWRELKAGEVLGD